MPSQDFNTEVIWENNRDLFGQYFKEEILKNRFKLAFITLDENATYEENAKRLAFLNTIIPGK